MCTPSLRKRWLWFPLSLVSLWRSPWGASGAQGGKSYRRGHTLAKSTLNPMSVKGEEPKSRCLLQPFPYLISSKSWAWVRASVSAVSLGGQLCVCRSILALWAGCNVTKRERRTPQNLRVSLQWFIHLPPAKVTPRSVTDLSTFPSPASFDYMY